MYHPLGNNYGIKYRNETIRAMYMVGEKAKQNKTEKYSIFKVTKSSLTERIEMIRNNTQAQ